MVIAAIVRAALLAQEKTNRQERLYYKRKYQTLFVNAIKNKAAFSKFPEIKTMTRECKFLANAFFENAYSAATQGAVFAKSLFAADGKGEEYPSEDFVGSRIIEKRVFQLRLVEFIKQVLENDWLLISKLRIASIWQNTCHKNIYSIDNYDKKNLREVLLDRSNMILWESFTVKLEVLVQLSMDFLFYHNLREKGSTYMVVGSVFMVLSLLFISTPLPVMLSVFSLGLFLFLTAFALDGYGRYNLKPTLNSIKKSIETLPPCFYEASYEASFETEEIETDEIGFYAVPNGI